MGGYQAHTYRGKIPEMFAKHGPIFTVVTIVTCIGVANPLDAKIGNLPVKWGSWAGVRNGAVFKVVKIHTVFHAVPLYITKSAA